MLEHIDVLRTIITARRSIRKYQPNPIPATVLDEIIQVERMAPSGNNMQTTHLIVIQKSNHLEELRQVMTDTLAQIQAAKELPASMIKLIRTAKKEVVDVSYT